MCVYIYIYIYIYSQFADSSQGASGVDRCFADSGTRGRFRTLLLLLLIIELIYYIIILTNDTIITIILLPLLLLIEMFELKIPGSRFGRTSHQHRVQDL